MTTKANLNADNTDLQSSPFGPGREGFVDEVNGNGAVELPEFHATRWELIQLVKYWESYFLRRVFPIFKERRITSSDMQASPFAERQVLRIKKLLGEEGDKAVREAREEFAKEIGEGCWKKHLKYLSTGKAHCKPARRRPAVKKKDSDNMHLKETVVELVIPLPELD